MFTLGGHWMQRKRLIATWLTRMAVGFVFAVNLNCALAFILQPQKYAPGFEIDSVPGKVAVQGFGILFLMWNATYPPVILHPNKNRRLYWIILSQQVIGVIGETWLWLQLPAGHAALAATGLRFILFDGLGLVLMGAALALLCMALASRKAELSNQQE
jgi:hypothetical protein